MMQMAKQMAIRMVCHNSNGGRTGVGPLFLLLLFNKVVVIAVPLMSLNVPFR